MFLCVFSSCVIFFFAMITNQVSKQKKRPKTYLPRRDPDLVVVRSITADETVVTVLQSSVLNKFRMILLQMSIVLVQTARAMNATGRADVRHGSVVNASGVHDTSVQLRSAVTAVAVKATVVVTTV